MQDQPKINELVSSVKSSLEEVAMPELKGRAAFHARVATNVMAIIEREIELGTNADAEENLRLENLLRSNGSTDELNRTLCQKIRAREVGPSTPGLSEHLWQTTLDKLAINQPTYSGYRAALKKRGE